MCTLGFVKQIFPAPFAQNSLSCCLYTIKNPLFTITGKNGIIDTNTDRPEKGEVRRFADVCHMNITKILNNNVAVSRNAQGKEIVVMGRGLAFKSHVGDVIDPAKVEKTFTLSEPGASEKFLKVASSIPLSHMLMAERIIGYAKIHLGKKLSDSIYVTLPDHVSGSIARHEESIVLSNPLKWDIKRFYPDEFAIGQKAVQIIAEETGIRFEDDEAAFIALHFVNAEMVEDSRSVHDVYQITCIMQEVCTIVHDFFHIDLDESTLSYYRFITHLKFFAQRVLSGVHYDDDEQEMLDIISFKYPKAYACTQQISQLIEQQYGFSMTSDEKLYLTAHIARIQPKEKGGSAAPADAK